MAISESPTALPESHGDKLWQRDQEIQVAKFMLLCGNLGWVIVGTLVTGLALFVAAKDQMPLSQRLPWITMLLLLIAVRVVMLRYWLRVPTTSGNVNARIVLATSLSTCLAILFGLFGYLAVSENSPLTNLLVIMVSTGMVASASAAISHMLPMFMLYIFPLMLPVAYRMTQFEQAGYHWIAGLIILYLVVCVGTSRNIRASIMQSINIRFDNQNLLGSLRDEKQRAEVALKSEEQANLAKSKFLAAASHDLRQPLHSLRLFTATLELQTRNTQHKTLVSQIDSSVKSLEDLFNALLDISKLDAGTLSVEKNHVFLDSLLSQIEGEFKPLAHEKQLHFNVELADHVIFTDALLLERLIRNLCSNAIRYTDAGGVDVQTRVEDDRVFITISDTGVGIPEADHVRVFDEFVQLGNVERDRNQGIGLGLSIVRRLSNLLGLDVKVQSEPGKGSTFTVGVSLGDRAQCEHMARFPADSGEAVDSLFVLVIDDEEEVCLAIEGLLETWGCIVMTATSGDTALQQLDEIGEVPDVLVSDYRLRQGETGGDVIRRIRTHLQCEIPAVILTGDIAPDRLQDIKSLGFPMLHKPCEPEELRQLLASAAKTAPTSGFMKSLKDGAVAKVPGAAVPTLRVVEG
ncbi:hybrid sensor histidine kinase/response regulator [Granulosicoccus antarcticus]|uniref:histidine kinase n=1 Tax=Granulosicoccus antarcticus IMCC3135 TaxID=1192854 RepID=A0A2Z2NSN3_9GAMM|nr:hybrid sensor histidine kinase/response regulator [Granulosicoccus antarcticus]ASJ73031.1 Sensor histidine kinase RcsC [Granulosicoccus antarcticus IMCC3135]